MLLINERRKDNITHTRYWYFGSSFCISFLFIFCTSFFGFLIIFIFSETFCLPLFSSFFPWTFLFFMLPYFYLFFFCFVLDCGAELSVASKLWKAPTSVRCVSKPMAFWSDIYIQHVRLPLYTESVPYSPVLCFINPMYIYLSIMIDGSQPTG